MDNSISSTAYQTHVPINNSSISSRSELSENTSAGHKQSDNVSLSPEAISRNTQHAADEHNTTSAERNAIGNSDITAAELREVQKLKQRDAEVKAHEQAHLSTAGQYAAGGASFSYTTGPNGKRYVTGGEVPIDLSKEKDPQSTLQKMTQIRRAALAPATPSAADRNIAARASMIAAEAMSEIHNTEENKTDSDKTPQLSQQEESDTQSKSSVSSVDNRIPEDPDTFIPAHTRHMVLQAYTDRL